MKSLALFLMVAGLLLQATTAALASASAGNVSNTDATESRPALPEAAAPEDEPPAPATAPPRLQNKPSPSANPLWAIPIKQLSNTRERPIFSPSRRAATPAETAVVLPPPVQKQEPETPPLALLGTIINGDDGYGIFMDQTKKESVRIRIGEIYQGWKLRSIKAGAAQLEKGQDSAELAFPKPANDRNHLVRFIANRGVLLRWVLPRFGGSTQQPPLSPSSEPEKNLPASDPPVDAPADERR